MKKRVVCGLSSFLLTLFLAFNSNVSVSQPVSSTRPTNPQKFYPEMDESHMNQRLENLCHEMYKTPEEYTRYFDKFQYVPLKSNLLLSKDYLPLVTRIGYNKRKLRIFIGVEDTKIKEPYQIDDVFFWFISTTKENSTTQHSLTIDKTRKIAEIMPLGEDACRGEFCESLFDKGDKILDYTWKRLGFDGKKDLKSMLYLAQFRVATKAVCEGFAAKIQDQSRGKAYISVFRNEMVPTSMISFPETKAYEIVLSISGSEPYGIVILTYGSKVKGNGIAQMQFNSEPCMNVIYFDFNLQSK